MRKPRNSKLAFVMLARSLRKQDDETLNLIIQVANMVLEERKEVKNG